MTCKPTDNINSNDYFKPNHYWLQVHSDMKGRPTEYVCIDCGKRFKVPSRDKQARDYLKLKYGTAKAS